MKNQSYPSSQQLADPSILLAPNFTRPVWPDQQMTCDQCQYNGQDIDTFPCAKCHTRG